MKIYSNLISIFLLMSTTALAENTNQTYIESVETIYTGFHSIWLTGAIPSQGCTLSDRAVIDEQDIGGKAQLSASLTALSTGKKVVIGVSGCANIGVGNLLTAPKVVKIQLNKS